MKNKASVHFNAKKYLLFLFSALFLFASCSTNYVKKLKNTEESFYRGDYNSAVNEARALVEKSDDNGRLLYLMEAGVILHSMGEFKKSNLAFEEADKIAETIKTSITRSAAAFLLNDTKANYTGENFERVMIKFYIALNYINMNDMDSAKRYFRKLDYDLKEMKIDDSKYKQNSAARFLDAIISESFQNYNDARAQYKNIQMIDPDNKEILASLYALALKEGDEGDMEKYREGTQYISAFSNDISPRPYNKEMGELVIIHEAGKAPTKESRGRLLDDREFLIALRIAIEVALHARGAGLSTTGVLAMMGTAENPIPVYAARDKQGAKEIDILLNNKSAGRTIMMNDFKETALRNFNDDYSKLITRNVASIAVKIVIAAIAADKISGELEKGAGKGSCVGNIIRFGVGAGTGGLVAATVEPDLRCWRLLPSNFQVKRIFLEPGEYDISFNFNNNTLKTKIPEKVVIKKGKPAFINFRSMSGPTE